MSKRENFISKIKQRWIFYVKIPPLYIGILTKCIICILFQISFVQMVMGFSPLPSNKVDVKLDNIVNEPFGSLNLCGDLTSNLFDIRISGIVTDDGGEPLPGATVTVEGTTIGTVIDIKGEYELTVSEDATLIFSFIGFQMQRVAVGNSSQIDITLMADVSSLDEFVVVGYGTQKKSDFIGAVYSVKAEQLENMPNTNILQGLQGLVPGLAITNNQSSPGSSSQIRIRGESSLSASNDPLIILDGIPYGGNLTDK